EIGVLQHRDEERTGPARPRRAGDEGRTGRSDGRTATGPRRIGVAAGSVVAGHVRPAVVPSADDDIDLVVAFRAMLDLPDRVGHRLEGDALRVAMPPRQHGAAAGCAREDRVVGGYRPSGIQAKDLPVQRVRVLRPAAVAGLTHRYPELAVGSEADTAAVMVRVRERAAADDVGVEGGHAPTHAITQHLIAPLAFVVTCSAEVHETVAGAGRIERDAHQA